MTIPSGIDTGLLRLRGKRPGNGRGEPGGTQGRRDGRARSLRRSRPRRQESHVHGAAAGPFRAGRASALQACGYKGEQAGKQEM